MSKTIDRRVEERNLIIDKDEVACATCPHALWFSPTVTDTRCFCQIMHSLTWTSKSPYRIELCDGHHK